MMVAAAASSATSATASTMSTVTSVKMVLILSATAFLMFNLSLTTFPHSPLSAPHMIYIDPSTTDDHNHHLQLGGGHHQSPRKMLRTGGSSDGNDSDGVNGPDGEIGYTSPAMMMSSFGLQYPSARSQVHKEKIKDKTEPGVVIETKRKSKSVLDGSDPTGRGSMSSDGTGSGGKIRTTTTTTTLRRQRDTLKKTPTTKTVTGQPPMHILYGGYGNHTGFLRELSASIKSVLLNAPLDSPLYIHFMVDAVAQRAIQNLIHDGHDQTPDPSSPFPLPVVDLSTWTMRQPVYIRTYNVESYLPKWIDEINDTYKHYPKKLDRFRHTPGSYFRLFANQVLTASTTDSVDGTSTADHNNNNDDRPVIENVLWMDSDVYIMSNLQRLWNQVGSRTQYFFQWGYEKCAGFIVINISMLDSFWTRIKSYPLLTLTNYTVDEANAVVGQKGLGDQKLVRSLAYTEPDLVGWFPDRAWDVSANNGPWWNSHPVPDGTSVRQHRQKGVGMMHFNGGGSSSDSAFESHPYLVDDIQQYYQEIDEAAGEIAAKKEAIRKELYIFLQERQQQLERHQTSTDDSSNAPDGNKSNVSSGVEAGIDTSTETMDINATRAQLDVSELDRTWKLAHYYDKLDWTWAQYMVESQVADIDRVNDDRSDRIYNEGGYKVKVFHQ